MSLLLGLIVDTLFGNNKETMNTRKKYFAEKLSEKTGKSVKYYENMDHNKVMKLAIENNLGQK